MTTARSASSSSARRPNGLAGKDLRVLQVENGVDPDRRELLHQLLSDRRLEVDIRCCGVDQTRRKGFTIPTRLLTRRGDKAPRLGGIKFVEHPWPAACRGGESGEEPVHGLRLRVAGVVEERPPVDTVES